MNPEHSPLAASTDNLALTVDRLAKEVSAVNERNTTLRRLFYGLGFTFLLDIVITGVLGVVLHSQQATTAEIQRQQHNTCTLYGFVINSYNTAARAKSVMGPIEYDNFYRKLQAAADENRPSCGIPHKI